MSYPFTLRFLVGRLLIDGDITEKVCIVDQGQETKVDDESINEIWTSDEIENFNKNPNNLGMIEFQIGANQSTFDPEFRLLHSENYVWDYRDGIKDTLNKLDLSLKLLNQKVNNYRLYYVLGPKLPPGLISGITKRFGKNLLLEIDDKIKKKMFWSILIKPKKLRGSNILNDPFVVDLISDKFRFDILGEALSTNCAEIDYTF